MSFVQIELNTNNIPPFLFLFDVSKRGHDFSNGVTNKT